MNARATRVLAAAAALMLAHAAGAATVLSFEQVLDRAQKSHAISDSAYTAAASLEQTPRFGFPVIRAEASATSAENLDVFAQNVFRTAAISALLAVDYPIADGGIREKQTRVAKLDAESFRQRMRETANDLFRETLDAVARLFAAQERLRVLNAGLQRAVEMRDRAKKMLEMQEISNVTAAQWQDEAIVAESQLLDLDLQRLEAETHVKQLMGDTTSERIEIVVPIEETPPVRALSLAANPDPLVRTDEGVARATLQYERKKLALEEAEAARQPQVILSAFGGAAVLDEAAGRDHGRNYGLYGLRFTVSLPMFDVAKTRRVAEARLEAEQAAIERRTTTELIRRQTSTLWLGIAALEKRIALLEQAVDVSRKREESVVRLVSEGLRSENEVAEAAAERTRRESDLIGAKVELWKYQQILKHRTEAPEPLRTADSR
jgi:outer membrane protein TolC